MRLQKDLEQALIDAAAQLKKEAKRRITAQREFRHMQWRESVEQKVEHVRNERDKVEKELQDLEAKVRRPAGEKPPPLPTLPKKQLGKSAAAAKPSGKGKAAAEQLPGFIAEDEDEIMDLQDSGVLQWDCQVCCRCTFCRPCGSLECTSTDSAMFMLT